MAAPAAAQTGALPQEEITVATRVVPPFVKQDGTVLSGFAVELWRAIAVEVGVKSRFVVYDSIGDVLKSVQDGRDKAAIAAISITSERAQYLDFSQPMFRSGLSILVPASRGVPILSVLFSKEMMRALGIFLLVLLVPAHIIWFLARGRDDGLPIREAYIPGIFDAVFWCAESMGGAAQAHPARLFARIAAIVWIYAGIVMIAYFTAFATTSLTVNSLQGDIRGPRDLAGRRVAVVGGSTSARYAEALKATTVPFPNHEAAAAAMLAGKAAAVLYDTPMLLNLAKSDPRVQIAGQQFRPESYGIAFALNSPLRRPVNNALLTLMENGTYEDLYKKYFSQD